MELRRRNVDVMTEVIFESGGRADILLQKGLYMRYYIQNLKKNLRKK